MSATLHDPRPVVFDCNIFLQAIINARGPAYACLQKAFARELTLFVAPFVLREIRLLPSHRKLARFPHLTPERIERFIEELVDFAELVSDPPATFIYPRDPDDALYVDLAVATNALLIVSRDKDLLDLMNDSNSQGKSLRTAHPTFRVLSPPQLLAEFFP